MDNGPSEERIIPTFRPGCCAAGKHMRRGYQALGSAAITKVGASVYDIFRLLHALCTDVMKRGYLTSHMPWGRKHWGAALGVVDAATMTPKRKTTTFDLNSWPEALVIRDRGSSLFSRRLSENISLQKELKVACSQFRRFRIMSWVSGCTM
jgi:hypothetical protein